MIIGWCHILLVLEWLSQVAQHGVLLFHLVRHGFSFAQDLGRLEQLVLDAGVLHLNDASAGRGHIPEVAPGEAGALSLTEVATSHITETLHAILIAQHLLE